MSRTSEYNEKGMAAAILAKQSDGKSICAVWKQTAQQCVDQGCKPIGVFLDNGKMYAEPVKAGKDYVWQTKAPKKKKA